MEFIDSDWDWSDVHQGLTAERQERLAQVISEIRKHASKLAAQYKLVVEIPKGVFSLGVQGDKRTYTPVVMIVGAFPGNDVLQEISSRITNSLPVSRVLFETAKKD